MTVLLMGAAVWLFLGLLVVAVLFFFVARAEARDRVHSPRLDELAVRRAQHPRTGNVENVVFAADRFVFHAPVPPQIVGPPWRHGADPDRVA